MFLINKDNHKIYYEENYVSKPKAFIIIVHGFCEHCRRYDEFVNFLNENDYSVLRYDLVGHGQSEGERGQLKNYMSMVYDLDMFVSKIKKTFDKKIFLFGHSMGGLIVSLYTSIFNEKISGVISSGGANGFLKVPGLAIFKFISYKPFRNKLIKNSFPKNSLCFDEIVEKLYWTDPFVLKEFKLGLVINMFLKAPKFLIKKIKNITIPFYFLHGELDIIVPPEISFNAFKKISSSDKKIDLIKNSGHEILNDKNKQQVHQLILTWLNERVN